MIDKEFVYKLIDILEKDYSEEEYQIFINGIVQVDDFLKEFNLPIRKYISTTKLEIALILLDQDKLKEIIFKLNNKAFW